VSLVVLAIFVGAEAFYKKPFLDFTLSEDGIPKQQKIN